MGRGVTPVLKAKADKLRKKADDLEGKARPHTLSPVIDASRHAPPRRSVAEGVLYDFLSRALVAQSKEYVPVGTEGDYARDPGAAKRVATLITLDPHESIAVLAGRLERDERFVPAGVPAGETITFSTAVAGQARVARAGARILWIPEATHVGSGAMARLPSNETFAVLKPAPFDVVVFDEVSGDPVADLEPGPWPVQEAKLDRDAMTAYGVSFKLPRRARLDRGLDIVAAELVESMLAGVAAAVDRELVVAMDAAMRNGDDTPNAAFNYSHRRAADSGTFLNEIYGLLASDRSDGIALSAGDGAPTIDGFPVEVCKSARASMLANFSRFGVWIDPDVDVVATHLPNGGLQITSWIRLQASLPDLGAMWWAPF